MGLTVKVKQKRFQKKTQDAVSERCNGGPSHVFLTQSPYIEAPEGTTLSGWEFCAAEAPTPAGADGWWRLCGGGVGCPLGTAQCPAQEVFPVFPRNSCFPSLICGLCSECQTHLFSSSQMRYQTLFQKMLQHSKRTNLEVRFSTFLVKDAQ